ncbi:MAG: alpha/beta hydrolase-fold protein [Aeromicrobium erythreum]
MLREPSLGPARRVLGAVLALVVVGSSLAGCRAERTGAAERPAVAECATPRPSDDGTSDHSVVVDGRDRSYEVHVPPGYDGRKRLPVVVLFHGFGGDASTFLASTRMADVADAHDFLVVVPQATGLPSRWDYRGTQANAEGDLPMVHDLVRQVRRDWCTDPSRYYAMGFSNGSVLTLTLACDPHRDFAAFGAVSGPWYPTRCRDLRSVPIAYLHGTADRVAPYGGGPTKIGRLPGVDAALDRWVAHDGCVPTPRREQVASRIVERRWSGCGEGVEIRAFDVRGGGHAWPGGDPAIGTARQRRVRGLMTQEIHGSQLLWTFVSQFRLPRGDGGA